MLISDTYKDFCYPTYDQIDLIRLNLEISKLFLALGISKDIFLEGLKTNPVVPLNISYLPGLHGKDRWNKHCGRHFAVKAAMVSETDFTEFLSELKDTYIEEVLNNIFLQHLKKFGTKFQGRCQIVASRPTHCYSIHRDFHTNHRYHIPLETDDNFLWLFKSSRDINAVHMPADGRIWYLNPKDIEHTVCHLGTVPRMHILLTSGI